MTEKMYGNLQEKYEIIVFQILKMYKAFSNFGYNSTIRKKYTRLCTCLFVMLPIKFFSSSFQVDSVSLF